MDTNFFSQLEQIGFAGDLQIVISKGEDNVWIVSTLLLNPMCGDKAKELIVPLLLRGTAQELDEGYVATITAPIEKASGLMDNMDAFVRQLEEAQKQSAMEKGKTEKQNKEREAKDKKYKDAMIKVDELEKEGKHRDAWMKVPETTDHPDKAEEIRKRKAGLSEKFAPDLFGMAVNEPIKESQPTSGSLDGHALSAMEEENMDNEGMEQEEPDDEFTEDDNHAY
ncbi:PRTRC system protein E [Sphingobacterium sp. KU25419]|nr:PRTRC system protein E [Sphingobacterium sp. KU25419]